MCDSIKEVSIDLLKEEMSTTNTNNNNNMGDVKSLNLDNELKLAESKGAMVSVLTILKPKRDDSRVYVCKASNDYGWAELKIRLQVKGKCATR